MLITLELWYQHGAQQEHQRQEDKASTMVPTDVHRERAQLMLDSCHEQNP